MRKTLRFLVIIQLMVTACQNDADTPDLVVSLPESTEIGASCQSLELSLSGTETADVHSDVPWITVEHSVVKAPFSLYIEQNDGGRSRSGKVTVVSPWGGHKVITITQKSPDNNSAGQRANVQNNFGVGWGYDAGYDYADEAGLRGQIFNAPALRRNFEDDDAIELYNMTQNENILISEQSAESMSSKIGTKVFGGVDLKVASAKIEAEFARQISENKSRIYVWYRDYRKLKECNLAADILDEDIAPACFTQSFSEAVDALAANKMSCRDFVKVYGTHLVCNASIGGKLDYYFTCSTDLKETIETVTLTVSVKFLGMKKTSTSVNEKTWQEIKKDFIGNFRVSGGGQPAVDLASALDEYCNKGAALPTSKNYLLEAWQKALSDPNVIVPDDLTIIDFRVIPIWEIVRLSDRQTSDRLKNYICGEYLK